MSSVAPAVPVIVEACPGCGAPPESQAEVRRVLDGAIPRVDFACADCGAEHPIWL